MYLYLFLLSTFCEIEYYVSFLFGYVASQFPDKGVNLGLKNTEVFLLGLFVTNIT